MEKKSLMFLLLTVIAVILSSIVIAEDTDGDGLDDVWERMHFDSLLATGEQDADNDGLTNLEEQGAKTSPANSDSDSDGFLDKEEIEAGTSPLFNSDKPSSINLPLIMVALLLVLAAIIFLFMRTKKKPKEEKKEDNVAEYIKTCRQKGFRDDQIKQELVKDGYKVEEIKKYFQK